MIKELVKEKTQVKVKNKYDEPKQYKVILLNDDYTTMDFVVLILITIFKKKENEAVEIMLKIHTSGSAVVGVYSFDIANTKVKNVETLANLNNFPLKAIMEEA
ncbi:MAG: ATP-dependent Clp protease adaptor ClpS [Fusobacteria bacterium]|nr:ATP-dependent Clp protease adaptor ClpS [Fusobacteriota bacterium]